jgi:NitT/TauT family transport system substrate-binding protein
MTRTPRRTMSVAATLGALALTLAACSASGADDAAGGGETTDKLTISATGVDSLPFMAMLQAGIDKGWFEEEGIDVSLYSASGGGNTLRVVTSGDADMAIAGNTSIVLAAKQEDSHLTIIAPWFQVNDFSWIAPAGTKLEDGAVLGFSSAGSSTELITKNLEAKLGGITTQAVGGAGDNWTAAQAKQITAGWAMQPFIADKVMNEGAEVVLNSRDVIGDMPADLVAVNDDYAEANPENLKAFFRAVERLNEWIVSEPDAAAAELAPLLDVSEEVMVEAMAQTPDLAKAYSLAIDAATLDNLSELMMTAGQIEEPIDWSTELDQQYLPEDAQADL